MNHVHNYVRLELIFLIVLCKFTGKSPENVRLKYFRNNRDQMTSEHLLHAASQIAAGMCFLEKENLVHRYLLTYLLNQ